jgi:hypothetical protein
MGLLVAGITGGAALIKSAQLRVLITEFQNYRVAFNTYYGLYDRVPGSSLDYGCNGGADTVCYSNHVWQDLKDEGIIEKTHTNGFIASKYKNAYWRIVYGTPYFFNIPDFQGTNSLGLFGQLAVTPIGVLGVRETQSLLDKLDDCSPNTGLVRACEYDNATATECEEATPESLSEADDTNTYALVSKLDF